MSPTHQTTGCWSPTKSIQFIPRLCVYPYIAKRCTQSDAEQNNKHSLDDLCAAALMVMLSSMPMVRGCILVCPHFNHYRRMRTTLSIVLNLARSAFTLHKHMRARSMHARIPMQMFGLNLRTRTHKSEKKNKNDVVITLNTSAKMLSTFN